MTSLFGEFVKAGVVKRIKVDKERSKSLVVESDRKMNFLKEKLEKLGIKNENANDYVEYCYDMIMHLVRAKLHLGGYYASGQGAHEAEVSYLKVIGFAENEVQFADRMRLLNSPKRYAYN